MEGQEYARIKSGMGLRGEGGVRIFSKIGIRGIWVKRRGSDRGVEGGKRRGTMEALMGYREQQN